MKLIGKNDFTTTEFGEILKKNKIEYVEKEWRRDFYSNAIFVYQYRKDDSSRVAIELMQLVNIDDPWFCSYVWELENENEPYDIDVMWCLMKSEIEEQREQ